MLRGFCRGRRPTFEAYWWEEEPLAVVYHDDCLARRKKLLWPWRRSCRKLFEQRAWRPTCGDSNRGEVGWSSHVWPSLQISIDPFSKKYQIPDGVIQRGSLDYVLRRSIP